MTLRGPAASPRTHPAPSRGKRRSPGLCLWPQEPSERQPSFFLLCNFAFVGTTGFLASTKAIPGQAHPVWFVLCSGGFQEVACISSLKIVFCSHNEKGVLEGFSEHPSILVCVQEAHFISVVTHVLYIHTASMAECEVTCGHTGMLPGGGIPGRGSMGALEQALLFSPHSDSGLRTIAPSLSLVSLPAELKDRVCCFLCLGSHLDTTALL